MQARLTGFVRLVHPFPTLLNAVVVAALACVATGGWPGVRRVGALALTMLVIQAAIGAANDWADRDVDAVAKPWKPIPSGRVPARAAAWVAVGLVAAAALLATTGGVGGWLLAMLGLGVGLAYDLGLKRTPLSALTYAVALPLLPLWVWTALGREERALYAVVPVGVLLGLALQLANALPDAGADGRAGVRGTLQWLGVERGRWVAWGAFAGACGLALVLGPGAGLRPAPFLPLTVAALALLGGAVVAYRRRPGEAALRLGWTLLAPGAGLLAVGWLASLR